MTHFHQTSFCRCQQWHLWVCFTPASQHYQRMTFIFWIIAGRTEQVTQMTIPAACPMKGQRPLCFLHWAGQCSTSTCNTRREKHREEAQCSNANPHETLFMKSYSSLTCPVIRIIAAALNFVEHNPLEFAINSTDTCQGRCSSRRGDGWRCGTCFHLEMHYIAPLAQAPVKHAFIFLHLTSFQNQMA